jgi:hypothetical protein
MECCQFKISHLRSSTLTRSLSAAAMQSITCCQQFERGQEKGISDERKTECTTDLLDTRARTHTHTNRCPRISFSCHARTKCTGNHLLLYNLFTHSGIPLALSPPPPPPPFRLPVLHTESVSETKKNARTQISVGRQGRWRKKCRPRDRWPNYAKPKLHIPVLGAEHRHR